MQEPEATIRLVVNADGFGRSQAISRGTLRAHGQGIVTSTSVLGNCNDPQAVSRELAQAPKMGVGAQLTLLDGSPVSPPDAVPSLVGADGKFPLQARELFLRWAQNALRAEDIERELEAQLARLRDAGLRVDHIDTYQQLGFLPLVARVLEKIARRHGIAGVRTRVESPTFAWLAEAQRGLTTAAMAGLAWLSRRQMGAVRHGPITWGCFDDGRLDDVRILEIIGRLGPGIHELRCTPSEDSSGAANVELRALTSTRVREGLARRKIRLCTWGELF